MKRFLKSLQLKNDPSLINRYIKLHTEIPSEIVDGIKTAGFTRMDLYIKDNNVIMVVECPDDLDVDKAYELLDKLPGQKEWEKQVAEFQICNPDDSSEEKWKEMTKIFSLPRKKVFVSGCYDMLHSGHVAFFKEASKYGDLYVGIGSDKTIEELKNRQTVYTEKERLYMVKAVRYVKDAVINSGSGMMDFIESVEKFKPDIFIVNSDGGSEIKRQFCKERGIEYIELQRVPEDGLKARSTTDLRRNVVSQIPYRVDIAGTWIDQPYVSQYGPGWAITASIEPTMEFMERAGMSTSTRKAAQKIWKYQLPEYNEEMLARLLFCFENEPEDTKGHISGAQDAIGICLTGIARHYYDKTYWPTKIERITDEDIIDWVESHLALVPMFPRREGCSVVEGKSISPEKVQALTEAANDTWEAIKEKNLEKFAKAYQNSFEAQIAMFPAMIQPGVKDFIDKAKEEGALAWKMTGAGGGGYLLIVHDGVNIPSTAIPIKIRRL